MKTMKNLLQIRVSLSEDDDTDSKSEERDIYVEGFPHLGSLVIN